MNKLKIYLDTSVISHLNQSDAPEKMHDTLILWEDIKSQKYDVYLSDTTLDEINKCSKNKCDILMNYLAEIEYTRLVIDDEVRDVAQQIIDLNILTSKSYDDCIHIATAVVNTCDVIISWNFKHMVNIKTINGIRAISSLRKYRSIDIMQPTLLIQEDNE